MIVKSNEEASFPHKLLLIYRKVANLRKAFANKFRLNKTELSKIVQLGGFLGILFGPLLKKFAFLFAIIFLALLIHFIYIFIHFLFICLFIKVLPAESILFELTTISFSYHAKNSPPVSFIVDFY